MTGDADGMIMVWDPRHGVARQVLPRDRLGITALAFHPQSEHLLSGNMVGAVSRWQGEPPPPPPPAELLPERFYQDFRGAKPPRVPLRIEGEGTHDVTTPDQSGLRMTLPAGWNHPGVWVRPHVPVSGDFDITAGYELLKIEHPDKGYGAGVVLLAVSPGSQKMAKLCRLLRPTEGDRYLADLTDHARNKITANTVPTQARRGQLRLVREGSTIRYLVADGKEQEFREIHRDEFGARDVEEFAFVVSTHGGLNAVDARLVDLRIRSGRFKSPPPIAVAGAAADAGKPIAAGDAVQNAAPQNEPDANQETDADAAGASRQSWLKAAVFLFILFALVGLVTSVIRRTRPRPVESAARMAEAASSAAAAALPVRFTCAGCGHVLTARPGQAGKTGKCPHCGQTVHLPANAPETKTAEPRTGRRTAIRLAALGVLALLLGAGVLYLAMSPRIRPLSQPPNRPNLLNVPVGTETVPGVEESGFYNQEVDGRGRPFRWTDGKARLVIPLDRTKPPRALWLILQTTRPEEAAPVDLHVVANGKDLFSINTAGVWEKTLDLSDVNLGDELTLDIISSTFSPVDFPRFKLSDARSLGVRINGMRLLGAAE